MIIVRIEKVYQQSNENMFFLAKPQLAPSRRTKSRRHTIVPQEGNKNMVKKSDRGLRLSSHTLIYLVSALSPARPRDARGLAGELLLEIS